MISRYLDTARSRFHEANAKRQESLSPRHSKGEEEGRDEVRGSWGKRDGMRWVFDVNGGC